MSAQEKRGYAVKLRSKRVREEMDTLQGNDYQRVLSRLKGLVKESRPKGCEKLFDNIYRIRVGDIRIIYRVIDSLRLIEVGAVRRRSEKTYRDAGELF